MLLAAKSISYPDPSGGAAAGVTVNEALKKLGIAEQLQPKIKPAQGGARAMAMVASGDAEIGMTLLHGMTDPGHRRCGDLAARGLSSDRFCRLRLNACEGSRGRQGVPGISFFA